MSKEVKMRNYGVLGTGAVGGYYGGLLQKAGFPVHFLARSDAEALRLHGLQVLSPRGNFHLNPIQVYDNSDQMPLCDVVLVSWKTTSNFHLGSILPKILKPDGIVLVLQNGFCPEAEVVQVMPEVKVISGLCFLCCQKKGPAVVEHLFHGSITMAPYNLRVASDAIPQWLLDVAQDFITASVEIKMEGDWEFARWSKLVWNICFNGTTALLGINTSQLLEDPVLRQMVYQLAEETVSMAALHGLQLHPKLIERTVEGTRQMPPYDPSMKLDRDARRPMEIESIYGDMLKSVHAKGGKAPSISMIYALLVGVEGSLR